MTRDDKTIYIRSLQRGALFVCPQKDRALSNSEEACEDCDCISEKPSGLAPNRDEPGADGTVRKAHYGSGEQPWDTILSQGWGPAFAAGCVVRYLRRDKAVEHSLESARWYFDRLRGNAVKEHGMWEYEFAKLVNIMSREELDKVGFHKYG